MLKQSLDAVNRQGWQGDYHDSLILSHSILHDIEQEAAVLVYDPGVGSHVRESDVGEPHSVMPPPFLLWETEVSSAAELGKRDGARREWSFVLAEISLHRRD